MSMVVASALPMRTRRPRVLSGLFDEADDRVYRATTDDPAASWPVLSWGDTAPQEIRLGYPASLGAAYARNPLLTFFGLIALGWAGGFATWYFFGRGRRTR